MPFDRNFEINSLTQIPLAIAKGRFTQFVTPIRQDEKLPTREQRLKMLVDVRVIPRNTEFRRQRGFYLIGVECDLVTLYPKCS